MLKIPNVSDAERNFEWRGEMEIYKIVGPP
jgi:hypothetical protein